MLLTRKMAHSRPQSSQDPRAQNRPPADGRGTKSIDRSQLQRFRHLFNLSRICLELFKIEQTAISISVIDHPFPSLRPTQ
jgi:hypothetical protein